MGLPHFRYASAHTPNQAIFPIIDLDQSNHPQTRDLIRKVPSFSDY